MDCAVHPGAKAVDTCLKCQRAICAGCRQIVSGQAMCSFCLNANKQQAQTAPPPNQAGAFGTFGAPPPSQGGAFGTFTPAGSTGGADRAVDTNWTATSDAGEDPGIGLRIQRGLGWGAVFGQLFIVLPLIAFFFLSSTQRIDGMVMVVAAAMYMGIGAAGGAFIGFIVAVANPDDDESVGGWLGVAVGLGLAGLNAFLSAGQGRIRFGGFVLMFFLGRWIGTLIASRVMAPK